MGAHVMHTPTPWTAVEMPHGCNDEIHADDGSGRTICEFPYGLDENSAFIVRACNAHDDLVAALRKAKTCALTTEVRDVVNAALAKAEPPK